MEDFSLETTVVLYGVFHGLGGASVSINLGMMAYIGDIADESTKVSHSSKGFTFIGLFLGLVYLLTVEHRS